MHREKFGDSTSFMHSTQPHEPALPHKGHLTGNIKCKRKGTIPAMTKMTFAYWAALLNSSALSVLSHAGRGFKSIRPM